MIWGTAFAASLLTTGVYAGVADMGAVMVPRDSMMEARMDDMVTPMLHKRQSSTVNLNPTSASTNMTEWNSQTSALCVSALSQLTAASNPAGTAVCYNIPSLDTTTGTFMADLRLFQVSTPFGDFAGIPPEKITVGLQYSGASVSPVSQTAITARDTHELKNRAVTPNPLQTYMFVGQIDKAQLAQPMTMGILEALIMPVVSLNAVNSAGTTVTTNVSSNEAAFVNGVFSQEVIMSDLALAQLAVNDVVAGLKNGTVAFILPGTNLLIFPVGMVVTGLWAVTGISIYLFGTFQRVNYRESYRQRKARAGKGVSATI